MLGLSRRSLIPAEPFDRARKDASISKMLSAHLTEVIESEDRYEAAKRHAVQVLKKGFSLGGKITWRREDLYER